MCLPSPFACELCSHTIRYIARFLPAAHHRSRTMNKTFLKTKKGTVKVTFELPTDIQAQQAVVVGEFNNWDPTATPMKRKKEGRFSIALNLEGGREYRFRYYLDGSRWE